MLQTFSNFKTIENAQKKQTRQETKQKLKARGFTFAEKPAMSRSAHTYNDEEKAFETLLFFIIHLVVQNE